MKRAAKTMKIYKIVFIVLLFIVIVWSLNREYHYINLGSEADKHFEQMKAECGKDNAKECDALGSYYLFGWAGIKKDEKKGLRLLEKACRLGYNPSCSLRTSMQKDMKVRNR